MMMETRTRAPVQPGFNTIGRSLWNGHQGLSIEAAGMGMITKCNQDVHRTVY